ncbi:MAG: M20 family metallopeptidase [Elusimicrobiota bacterium]
MRAKLLATVDRLAPEILAVSRYVHSHPEEGLQETLCSKFLSRRLARLGFKVERPLKSLPTAFIASSRGAKRGPCVGYVAEYDCLPGIGHGCGHNLIAASGFGAAAALAPFARELGGSVRLFGTPAEEEFGAKVPMARAGLFDSADAVLMMHPESFHLARTSGLALDALQFRFLGRASHAACTPHEGRSALDALIRLFNAVKAMRRRVHGIITKGGTAPNIIPGLTEARFYVRAETRRRLDKITSRVKACARRAASAEGCRVEITEFESPLDEVRNDPKLVALAEKNLRSLGVRRILSKDPCPGSTDFGNVSQRVPALYLYCATAPKGMDLHTRAFARASAAPRAHKALILAAKTLALCGLDLLLRR